MSNNTNEQDNFDIATLFEKQGIKKVIIIDDNFNSKENSDFNITEAIEKLDMPKIKSLLEKLKLNKELPEKSAKKRIIKTYNESTDAELRDKIKGQIEKRDNVELKQLADLLKENNIKFQELGDDNWVEHINDSKEDEKSIVLIDYELTLGGKSGRSINGLDILNQIHDNDKFLCGMFSNTVTQDQERDYIEKWYSDKNVKLDQKTKFTVLSKSRTSGKESEQKMKDGFRTIIFNHSVHNLKNKSYVKINDATKEALESLNLLHSEDFTQMIITSSGADGAYEYDTLLRVFNIYFNSIVRKSINKDFTREFRGEILNINELLPHNPPNENALNKAKEIQRLESYATADEINNNHSPLALGDIFQFKLSTGKLRYIIVVDQECDITIRKNGERKNSNYIECLYLSEKREKDKTPEGSPKLDLPSHKGNKKFVAILTNPLLIKSELLDACCLSELGETILGKIEKIEPAVGLTEGWKKRAKISIQKLKDIKGLIDSVKEESTDTDKFTAQLLKENLIQSHEDDRHGIKFDFKNENIIEIKRVNRLNALQALLLLATYNSYRSRIALPHDLVKKDKE